MKSIDHAFRIGRIVILLAVSTIYAEDWTFMGPAEAGPFSHMSFYQHPRKPNIMLVASRGSKSTKGGKNQGVWRSTDGGKTWKHISRTVGYMVNTPQGLYAAPSNPDRLYVVQEISPNFCVSLDAGATWKTSPDAPYKHGICLAIHPTNPDILFAGADDGVWKSTDGGKTWKSLREGLPPAAKGISNTCVAIVIDPKHPNIVYAGFLYAAMNVPWGVYKSVDGGASWKPVNNGLPEGSLQLDLSRHKTKVKMVRTKFGLQYRAVRDLILDKGVLLAVTRQSGVYRSRDGGGHWERIWEAAKEQKEASFFASSISVHPQYANLLFLGTGSMELLISTDGGRTWGSPGSYVPIESGPRGVFVKLPWGEVKKGKSVTHALGGFYYSSTYRVHVDVSDPRRLYVPTDQGLFTTVLNDGRLP
ncbi:MAG: hypothetical protein D6820_02470 [Lentisphaerae bacterium]|nr:MAG: hypothetical protein D6820_02470 [Lentisphaerota bacterium]